MGERIYSTGSSIRRIAARMASAEVRSCAISSSLRWIGSTCSTPFTPTMHGRLRHTPSSPYYPVSSELTVRIDCSSRRMASTMRRTASATA